VSVSSDKIKKIRFSRKGKDGQTTYTYAVRAEIDGMKLTKFVSKDDWNGLDVPEDAPAKASKSK
jgi:hypothetical protein